jgi:hypothetical protein
MQNFIYSSPVHSEEDLVAPICEAAATIRRKPGISESTPSLFVVVGDRNFEHTL